MAYTYIGKALGAICRVVDEPHLDLCDRISAQLSQMRSGDVNSTDTAASFIFAGARGTETNAENAARAKELRRAAIILKKLFPTEARQIQNAINPRIDTSESWVRNDLQNYVTRFAAGGTPTSRGFYLRGSFWAYANDAEREQARAGGAEALRMLDAGIRQARNDTLRVRWFGTTTAAALGDQLSALKIDVATQGVGICYKGNGAAPNTAAIRERGQGGLTTGPVAPARLEWGASGVGGGAVSLGVRYFDPGQTRIRRTVQHDITQIDSDITRGGMLIHELSHRFLATVDVPLAGNVRADVQARRPTPLGGDARAYGPVACHSLARHTPAVALTNADNYRHFCEDAFLV